MLKYIALFLVSFLFVSHAAYAEPRLNSDIGNLPLLPVGQHVGMHLGFNVKNPRVTRKSIKRGFEQAIDAGVSLSAAHRLGAFGR